jgi:Tol biopolymer transport system component
VHGLLLALVAAGVLVLPASAAAPSGLIVFSRAVDDDDHELFSIRPDGTGLRRLTDDDLPEGAPVLSPDRRFIASAGEEELLVHSTSGRRLQRISVPNAGPVTEPRWSPGGRWISFLVERCGDDDDEPSRACADLWIVRPDGSDQRRLVAANVSTHDLVPAYAWSPGGRSLVFERFRGAGLVVVDTVTRRTRVLRGTTGLRSNDPSWSRFGSIAFARRRGLGRGFDVYAVRSDGRRLRRVARARSAARPVWSPDGRQIVFLDRGLGLNLWRVTVVRRDGSRRRQIGEAASELTLAWSPDGRRLLWEAPGRRLLVGRADGRGRPRLLARGSFADWR